MWTRLRIFHLLRKKSKSSRVRFWVFIKLHHCYLRNHSLGCHATRMPSCKACELDSCMTIQYVAVGKTGASYNPGQKSSGHPAKNAPVEFFEKHLA